MPELHSDINVRDAGPDGAPVWEAMRRELWPDGLESHAKEIAMYFAGTLQEPAAVLMAESRTDGIVGFVELSIRVDVRGFEGKQVGYVEGLFVRPRLRHRGVARKLLQTARSWAHDQECAGFATDRAGRIITDNCFV
jgi:aminoglycoside 6'-N-acetyltransferase I